jgi:uncharacterized protein (DUF2235 family)
MNLTFQRPGAFRLKRIVICCDGTGIGLIKYMTEMSAPAMSQKSLVVSPRLTLRGHGNWCSMAFGWGIKTKILDAYRFLMATFEPGDELFCLGFSRGAYTVRSTFGLIRNSGLLKPQFAHKLEDAYVLYRRRDDPPIQMRSNRNRKRFSERCEAV